MAIQSAFYFTDGTTRTFPSTKHIASSSNVAVWMKRIVDDVWELTSYELWTLANNSIVFTVAPQSTVYSQIELRVADEADELTESPSNIALVAGSIESVSIVGDNIVDVNTVSTNITAVQNVSANATNINTVATNAASVNTVGLAITNVNTVATNIANVNTIATNIANVNTVAGISAGVTTVATNNANVTTVATNIVGLNSVVANLTEVLLADDNAAIATTKASEASDSAISAQLTAWEAEADTLTALSYASEAEDVLVNLVTSDGDGTFTYTPQVGVYSAKHYSIKTASMQSVDSIAELLTMDISLHTINVRGYNTANDGGGGLFNYDATQSAVNNGGTIINGWVRQYNGAVNVKWFGAVGDGVTDDTIAITSAIALNETVELIGGETYSVSALSWASKSKIKIISNGAIFLINETETNNTVGLSFSSCTDIEIDSLVVRSNGGYETGRSRLVQFFQSEKINIGYIDIEYTAQHLPPTALVAALWLLESGDYSIRFVQSSFININKLKINKADVPISVVDCYDATFNNTSITSYMKGFCIYGGEKITVRDLKISVKTPTYVAHMRPTYNDWRQDRPGNNGIIVGDDNAVNYPICKDLTLDNIFVSDSGEHGVRLSGENGDRQRFKLSNITTHNTGSSGIKILGSDTTYLYNSVLSNITMTDVNVDTAVTMSASDGMTSLVFSSTGNTITIAGIEFPENFGTDLTSITISGTVSNNGTFTILSRDSDTQITVSTALVNETASSATVSWAENFKVSHGIQAYNVRDMVISGFNISKVSNTYSCQQGIQIHDAVALVINSYKIANARDAGIGTRPNNGGTSNDCRRVNIGTGHIVLTTTGIDLDTEAIFLRNFYINGADIQNCTTGVRIYNSGTTPGALIGSFFIRAHFEACTNEFTTTLANCMVALEGDGAIPDNALIKNGSTYTDYTSGQFKVQKAGVWTAL